jgi:hypothetical protein
MVRNSLNSLALILFSCLAGWSQKDCVLKKDKDSIKVYSCASEGLKFRSIKSTFAIHVSLSQLVGFLLDIDHYTEWQYNTTESYLIKKVNEQKIIFYTKIAAPWPVSDRDMIVDMELSQDPKTKVVTILAKTIPHGAAENKHVVRVPMSVARWTIRPISSSNLKVEYTIRIDPGGAVPSWMMNLVAAEAPYESFRRLKEELSVSKFKYKKLHFITD